MGDNVFYGFNLGDVRWTRYPSLGLLGMQLCINDQSKLKEMWHFVSGLIDAKTNDYIDKKTELLFKLMYCVYILDSGLFE